MFATVQSFSEKTAEFKLLNPQPPSSVGERGSCLLSLNHFSNDSISKAIAINLFYSKAITELTICGMNLSVHAAESLNKGLLRAYSLKKLRLNLCINTREVL